MVMLNSFVRKEVSSFKKEEEEESNRVDQKLLRDEEKKVKEGAKENSSVLKTLRGKVGKRSLDNVQVTEMEKKRRMRRETIVGKKRRRNTCEDEEHVAVDEDAKKVKVDRLPLPALEKVFSYLDWKEPGTAMLVCRSWEEVGGHPSLWSQFPLQLKVFTPHRRRLMKFVKIRRLGWVKSVTVTLGWVKSVSVAQGYCSQAFAEVMKYLTRTEELFFFFGQKVNDDPINIQHHFMKMRAVNNYKLVRICVFSTSASSVGYNTHKYFVSNCDAGTNAFIGKTLTYGPNVGTIEINGLPGVQLSNEVVETLYTISRKNPIGSLNTNLMIGQKIDLEKLMSLLKHVGELERRINVEDCDNQEVAPVNAILDLLGSKDHGNFDSLLLPKELLLKSQFLVRLGGRANVEAFIARVPHFEVDHCTKFGLKLVDPDSWPTGPEN